MRSGVWRCLIPSAVTSDLSSPFTPGLVTPVTKSAATAGRYAVWSWAGFPYRFNSLASFLGAGSPSASSTGRPSVADRPVAAPPPRARPPRPAPAPPPPQRRFPAPSSAFLLFAPGGSLDLPHQALSLPSKDNVATEQPFYLSQNKSQNGEIYIYCTFLHLSKQIYYIYKLTYLCMFFTYIQYMYVCIICNVCILYCLQVSVAASLSSALQNSLALTRKPRPESTSCST